MLVFGRPKDVRPSRRLLSFRYPFRRSLELCFVCGSYVRALYAQCGFQSKPSLNCALEVVMALLLLFVFDNTLHKSKNPRRWNTFSRLIRCRRVSTLCRTANITRRCDDERGRKNEGCASHQRNMSQPISGRLGERGKDE